jgi:hypothetical protein
MLSQPRSLNPGSIPIGLEPVLLLFETVSLSAFFYQSFAAESRSPSKLGSDSFVAVMQASKDRDRNDFAFGDIPRGVFSRNRTVSAETNSGVLASS